MPIRFLLCCARSPLSNLLEGFPQQKSHFYALSLHDIKNFLRALRYRACKRTYY